MKYGIKIVGRGRGTPLGGSRERSSLSQSGMTSAAKLRIKEILMSEMYIAKNDERLDSIVYKHYQTLKYFEQVLKANPKLEPILKAGDKVFLPDIEIKESEEEALW